MKYDLEVLTKNGKWLRFSGFFNINDSDVYIREFLSVSNIFEYTHYRIIEKIETIKIVSIYKL
jgi:hypothetical protein